MGLLRFVIGGTMFPVQGQDTAVLFGFPKKTEGH